MFIVEPREERIIKRLMVGLFVIGLTLFLHSSPAVAGQIIGQLDLPVRSISVEGSYAYVVDYENLYVVDLSNLSNLRSVGQVTFDALLFPADVTVSRGFAFVLLRNESENYKIATVDIADPLAPQLLNVYAQALDQTVDTFVVEGNYAYLGGVSGLEIVDLSDPRAPRLAGTFDGLLSIKFVHAEYPKVYLGTNGGSIAVLDITDPQTPEVTQRLDLLVETAWAYAKGGDYLYVSWTRTWSTNNEGILTVYLPTMEFVGYIPESVATLQLYVAENRLYAPSTLGGRVYSLLPPDRPTRAGSFDVPPATKKLFFVGDRMYAAAYDINPGEVIGGLFVIRHLFQDVTTPRRVLSKIESNPVTNPIHRDVLVTPLAIQADLRFGIADGDYGSEYQSCGIPGYSCATLTTVSTPGWGPTECEDGHGLIGCWKALRNRENFSEEDVLLGQRVGILVDNIFAGPMKNSDLTGTTHTDFCAANVNNQVCKPSGSPLGYNQNWHSTVRAGDFYGHDIAYPPLTMDNVLSCGVDVNSLTIDRADDVYCGLLSYSGIYDGVYMTDQTRFENYITERTAPYHGQHERRYRVGMEFAPKGITPRVAAFILRDTTNRILAKDPQALVYFGDVDVLSATPTLKDTGLIPDPNNDGKIDGREYWHQVAVIYNAFTSKPPTCTGSITTGCLKGFWTDAGFWAYDDLMGLSYIQPSTPGWGWRAWNRAQMLIMDNVQYMQDGLASDATLWGFSATQSGGQQWGAGGDILLHEGDFDGDGNTNELCTNCTPNVHERCPAKNIWNPGVTLNPDASLGNGYWQCDTTPNDQNQNSGRTWPNSQVNFDVILLLGVYHKLPVGGGSIVSYDISFVSALIDQIMSRWLISGGYSNWPVSHMLYRKFYFSPGQDDQYDNNNVALDCNPDPNIFQTCLCESTETSLMDLDPENGSTGVRTPLGLVHEQIIETGNTSWWGSGTWTRSATSCFTNLTWPARPTSQLPSGY